MKFLRRSEVCDRTGLSYVTLWRKERAGDFPARRELGPNSVGWIERERKMD
jgi:predicted DNA-binding transcriptional regulator AlpA